MASRSLAAAIAVLLAAIALAPSAHAQDDAGSGSDAGNTFDAATPIQPLGPYTGLLAGGSDGNDYYRFPVALGDSINIELRGVLGQGSLPAPDNFLRLSFRLLSPQGAVLDTPNTNQGDTRLVLAAAPAPGDYRLHVTSQFGGFTGAYTFCFLRPSGPNPCPDLGHRPIEIILGGSIDRALTRVLLVPPTHGDLGNPLGPTALDYLDAVTSGIREWERVLHTFAADHSEYGYLSRVTVEIAVFDGAAALTDFDVIVTFAESGGGQFRGVATGSPIGRLIVLSLFSVAPRSGQVLADYPEWTDLEAVTKHEFAHTWGLGHTRTWTAEHGPDLMNSPYALDYGDGSPVGDGGTRTPKQCVSTLDLYGMALLYQWLDGKPRITGGSWSRPAGLPYALYC